LHLPCQPEGRNIAQASHELTEKMPVLYSLPDSSVLSSDHSCDKTPGRPEDGEYQQVVEHEESVESCCNMTLPGCPRHITGVCEQTTENDWNTHVHERLDKWGYNSLCDTPTLRVCLKIGTKRRPDKAEVTAKSYFHHLDNQETSTYLKSDKNTEVRMLGMMNAMVNNTIHKPSQNFLMRRVCRLIARFCHSKSCGLGAR
jgi:hypothetical protein